MSDLVCRSCGSADLSVFLSLGKMPLANALIDPALAHEPESRYPLDVAFCGACTLVQITVSVPPEEMFSDYAYFSSTSTTMVSHAAAIVARAIAERDLSSGDLAVELASNDGYLLQHYRDAGMHVLGVDPAGNVAAVAQERGIPTVVEFFGEALASALVQRGMSASVLHANNVLAHVPQVNDFVAGIATMIGTWGVAIIETPYVGDLVEGLSFDTIYHEHLFYYSLTSLMALLERNGLAVRTVERLPIHGGSLRLWVTAPGASLTTADPESVEELLASERAGGAATSEYFEGFAERVDQACSDLRRFCADRKKQGRRIAAYGAAAKGAVLLNAAGIGAETIDYVCDRGAYKQGRLMPGVRIPIVDPARLLEDMPDDVLLLAWNVADEVLDQQAEYRVRGGQFITPLPKPKEIG